MNKNNLPETASEALEIVAKLTFKPFDNNDWMAFSGCNAKTPKVAHYGSEDVDWVDVIIDDDVLFFWNPDPKDDDENEWAEFKLSDSSIPF